MKQYKWNIAIILIILVGLSVMLYPDFSSYWNAKNQSKVVASYNGELNSVKTEDYEQMWAAAEKYNKDLMELTSPYQNFDLVEGYEEILDISGTGIMGYLSIDEIGVEYPVYHGTSEGVLQIAVGHMQGSSLPTGGAGTHVVLSAHNGLADAELFTNLDQLTTGDTFSIVVLDRTLTYQVDQILVVEPHDFSQIQIEEGKDYCTLITCTPFGVNSHRLLVRGSRVEDTDTELPAVITEDARQIGTDMVAAGIFAFLFILTMPAYISIFYIKRRNQDKRSRK